MLSNQELQKNLTIDIRELKHLSCIDGLKGIGAFIIAFIWHYQHFSPKEYPLSNIFEVSYSHGYLMVELFFMLSGFGMALGYQKRIQKKEISFPIYLKNRFCKLYPPFLIALFVTGFLECIHIMQEKTTFVYGNFDLYHFLLNLLLLQNGLITTDMSFNAPSWCISICMICYIVFYIVSYRTDNERFLFYKCIVGLVIAECLLCGGWGTKPVFNSQMGRGISCFSIGVMLSYAWRYRLTFDYNRIGNLLLMLLIGGYIAIRYNPDIAGNEQQLFILGISPIIILTSLFQKQVNTILQQKVLVFLGSISLNIYLWHYPVQLAIKNLNSILSLNINFSSVIIWGTYVITTIFIATFDKYVASKYYRRMLSEFISQIKYVKDQL